MILNNIECSVATQCQNNECLLRRTQILGLKEGDSKGEYLIEKLHGKAKYPKFKISPVGLNLVLECESFK